MPLLRLIQVAQPGIADPALMPGSDFQQQARTAIPAKRNLDFNVLSKPRIQQMP